MTTWIITTVENGKTLYRGKLLAVHARSLACEFSTYEEAEAVCTHENKIASEMGDLFGIEDDGARWEVVEAPEFIGPRYVC